MAWASSPHSLEWLGVSPIELSTKSGYAFRGQDVPSQASMPESSSLSDQEAVLWAADLGIAQQ
jgi:hypothetical protein